MAIFRIDSNKYEGKVVNISGDGEIYIDGEQVHVGDSKRVVNITVEGDVELVQGAFGNLNVTGNSGRITSASGDIEVGGDIRGDVQSASGDIEVGGNIEGSVKTASGDVDVKGDIAGLVSTKSGDIDAKTISGGISM